MNDSIIPLKTLIIHKMSTFVETKDPQMLLQIYRINISFKHIAIFHTHFNFDFLLMMTLFSCQNSFKPINKLQLQNLDEIIAKVH